MSTRCRAMLKESLHVNSEETDTYFKVDGKRRGCMVTYAKKILDPQRTSTNWISLMLCVISISMDPLFFYIPVIKIDKNCMDLDKKLGIIFCGFRSVIDLFYIIYISIQLRTNTSAQQRIQIPSAPGRLLSGNYNSPYRSHKGYIDLVAVLPLPQVFGALWYFFSIEREINCWKKACIVINQTGCNHQSFNCHKSSGNYKFLNDVCSIKSQNIDFYDFGIYHDALKFGVAEGSFLQKFMYCFRWGLQSLSCFAQNLITSMDISENLFTISITISSVVLFIFLLGNMQLYLQSETTRLEDMKLKVREIEQWTTFKKLSENLRRQVQKYHRHVWRKTKGVDVENLLNKFPRHLSRKIKCDLCLDLLKKVPVFGSLPDQQLKAICERLKPVLYPTQTCIVGEGDPIDEMFFIMSGKLLSTISRDINFSADPLYLDEFCGEELSMWAIDLQSSSDLQLPISTRTIKTHTEVEAFALMANDLKDIFDQFRQHFPKRLLHIFRYHSLMWRRWAACIIQVAWRCYCQKKHDDDEKKRVKNELAAADGSSTSFVGATPFAANEIRRRMLMRTPTMFLWKPADPDFMDKEK